MKQLGNQFSGGVMLPSKEIAPHYTVLARYILTLIEELGMDIDDFDLAMLREKEAIWGRKCAAFLRQHRIAKMVDEETVKVGGINDDINT